MDTLKIQDERTLLQSLLEVGVNLSTVQDRQTMLEMILREARKLTHAEAGTLYVCAGDSLRFAAAQNDGLDVSQVDQFLLGHELPISEESLAGFVAKTGQVINISDTYDMPVGAPFRIDREFDFATGYRTCSIMAIPLMRPDGQCVGVLQLINCLGPGGKVIAFPWDNRDGTESLASMAAVTIHNFLLQEQLKQAQLDCIIRLSVAVEFRDDDTAKHVQRISYISGLIASRLGLDVNLIELIRHASPMHDIGKIGIPDAILLKPGPLTYEERNVVQTHTLIGADILADPPNELIAMAREVALTHHERWDGGGYPRAISGQEIPISGRIVGLADVFDALVSERCYKRPSPINVALEIVRDEIAGHFDPDVAEAFFGSLDAVLAYYEQIVEG